MNDKNIFDMNMTHIKCFVPKTYYSLTKGKEKTVKPLQKLNEGSS